MFDKFKKDCPKQFINCGIAESKYDEHGFWNGSLRDETCNLYHYPFTTARCFEQIKIGVGYHNAPVIIIGTGAGLSYSELGPTHHSLEDIAINEDDT